MLPAGTPRPTAAATAALLARPNCCKILQLWKKVAELRNSCFAAERSGL
jgi:hypothetical protein